MHILIKHNKNTLVLPEPLLLAIKLLNIVEQLIKKDSFGSNLVENNIRESIQIHFNKALIIMNEKVTANMKEIFF